VIVVLSLLSVAAAAACKVVSAASRRRRLREAREAQAERQAEAASTRRDMLLRQAHEAAPPRAGGAKLASIEALDSLFWERSVAEV
jgi:type II secretory pathway pseudopilin PulG